MRHAPDAGLCAAVHNGLRIRRVVDGRDHAVDNADVFVNDLHDRGKTIRCAGRCREQVMLTRTIKVVVHPDHDI